jgi:hypothetical protein
MESHTVVAVEWSQGIEDAWSDVATFFPKLIGFLAVLLIGYIVIKIIARVVTKALERVGFDRVGERGGIDNALERSGQSASAIAGKIVYYVLLLLVLQTAFGVFGDNAVSDMIDNVIAYVPHLIVAIVILAVALVIASAVRDIVGSSVGGLEYGPSLAKLAYVAIMVVGVFAALNQLKVAPEIVNGVFYAVLAVVAGSAIVAIGGGGIQPMRHRWEQTLARYDEEKPRLREHLRSNGGAPDRAVTDVVEGRGDVEMTRSEERTTFGSDQ